MGGGAGNENRKGGPCIHCSINGELGGAETVARTWILEKLRGQKREATVTGESFGE